METGNEDAEKVKARERRWDQTILLTSLALEAVRLRVTFTGGSPE